jgi:hypothetical protein
MQSIIPQQGGGSLVGRQSHANRDTNRELVGIYGATKWTLIDIIRYREAEKSSWQKNRSGKSWKYMAGQKLKIHGWTKHEKTWLGKSWKYKRRPHIESPHGAANGLDFKEGDRDIEENTRNNCRILVCSILG